MKTYNRQFGQCQHSFRVPDDGWQLHKQLSEKTRLMRCVLCRQIRFEKLEKIGWRPIEQMAFQFEKDE